MLGSSYQVRPLSRVQTLPETQLPASTTPAVAEVRRYQKTWFPPEKISRQLRPPSSVEQTVASPQSIQPWRVSAQLAQTMRLRAAEAGSTATTPTARSARQITRMTRFSAGSEKVLRSLCAGSASAYVTAAPRRQSRRYSGGVTWSQAARRCSPYRFSAPRIVPTPSKQRERYRRDESSQRFAASLPPA